MHCILFSVFSVELDFHRIVSTTQKAAIVTSALVVTMVTLLMELQVTASPVPVHLLTHQTSALITRMPHSMAQHRVFVAKIVYGGVQNY